MFFAPCRFANVAAASSVMGGSRNDSELFPAYALASVESEVSFALVCATQ